MLEPELRQLLLDGLRPPSGYTFEQAIGTTFSLDLTSLFTAPLAFTLFDRSTPEGRLAGDRMALLQSVRRYASQIDIFCQAGQIAVPKEHRSLFAYLEDSVHAVAPPNPARIFHPKIWLIRYRKSADASPLFRLLCLSRNLTFDRSWDTVLVLEGQFMPGAQADPGLAEFVTRLPDLCSGRGISHERRMAVMNLANELRSVVFGPPEGFDRIAFWPIGLRPRTWPFHGRIDRLLVVSPFLSGGCLARLQRAGVDRVLVSRADSFDSVGRPAVAGFSSTFVLNPVALPDEPGGKAPRAAPAAVVDEGLAERAGVELRGLHAKLYVADAGSRARVWTGSANATDAAFGGNVEFLVELEGRKGSCGVEATIGDRDDDVGFRKLLDPYTPPENPWPPTPTDELAHRLDVLQRAIAQLTYVASVTMAADDMYRLVLQVSAADNARNSWWNDTAESVRVRCRPLSLGRGFYQSGTIDMDEVRFDFERVSFEALTSFFVIELTLSEVNSVMAAEFVVNAQLVGAPVDRRERILVSLLESRADVIRYLLMLLEQAGVDDVSDWVDPQTFEPAAQRRSWLSGQGRAVLEPMVRTLARDPDRLDEIARLIADLEATDAGRKLVPDGWQDIWCPIWEAREALRAR